MSSAAVTSSTPAVLAPFVGAGVLVPADVHTATTVARLAGEDDPDVVLALALAVRGPRLSHVCVDLTTVRDTVTADGDAPVELGDLRWPEPGRWRDVVAASPLVSDGSVDGRPLTLRGALLYLDRYWRYERAVAARLLDRAGATADDVDRALLREGLTRVFAADPAGTPSRQRMAAAVAVLRRLAVIAGGPGTGKTHTIARVLALLHEQARARGGRELRVALVAPTGKAAARMEEQIHGAARDIDTHEAVRTALSEAEASTIHRLLRTHPGNQTRFRHDQRNPLPHDVVVCDETSMVSLALMAKLLDALRPDTRVVLVGDPEQLASVEAGAVLGDIVGPIAGGLRMRAAARTSLQDVLGADVSGEVRTGSGAAGIGDGIVILTRVHRYAEDSGIAALASAIQRGDDDAALEVLSSGRDDVRWLRIGADADDQDRALRPLRDLVVAHGRAVLAAARDGDAAGALAAQQRFRVLCAHRRGPRGVSGWVPLIERWLARGVEGFEPTGAWYLGQPVLVTRNDHRLGLYNGDIGVVVAGGDGLVVAFEGEPVPRLFGPARLDATEPVHAMTIHKSQGSQFEDVAVVLPDGSSPILTRELLYTGVTRGRRAATVVGTEDAVRAAIARPVQRASGLRAALWG